MKIDLERVKLDSGGYDRGGRYFGVGEPLWSYSVEVELEDGGGATRTLYGYVRAKSKKKALAEIERIVNGGA